MKKHVSTILSLLLLLQSVSAQTAFTVRVDTLFIEGHNVTLDDYSFSRYNDKWDWTRSTPYPSVLFEDDLYTVSQDNYGEDVLFTAKQPSLYIDAHNGWLQYEYVNRQYYFTGEFHQILRQGDYYYFINPKRVDSLRIDQSPGNPLVKNILPEIEGINRRISEWCDPVSGHGDDWFPFFRIYCIEGCCMGNIKHYVGSPSVDTFYRGAFAADEQLFYVINYGEEVFIAQRNGNNLIRVKELGRGWYFYDIHGDLIRWWNLGPGDNRLILPFSTAEGSAGLLTIDGNDIRIRYIIQNKTVVP